MRRAPRGGTSRTPATASGATRASATRARTSALTTKATTTYTGCARFVSQNSPTLFSLSDKFDSSHVECRASCPRRLGPKPCQRGCCTRPRPPFSADTHCWSDCSRSARRRHAQGDALRLPGNSWKSSKRFDIWNSVSCPQQLRPKTCLRGCCSNRRPTFVHCSNASPWLKECMQTMHKGLLESAGRGTLGNVQRALIFKMLKYVPSLMS